MTEYNDDLGRDAKLLADTDTFGPVQAELTEAQRCDLAMAQADLMLATDADVKHLERLLAAERTAHAATRAEADRLRAALAEAEARIAGLDIRARTAEIKATRLEQSRDAYRDQLRNVRAEWGVRELRRLQRKVSRRDALINRLRREIADEAVWRKIEELHGDTWREVVHALATAQAQGKGVE